MFEHYDLPPHDAMHHAIWERVKRAERENVDVLLEERSGTAQRATGWDCSRNCSGRDAGGI